MVFLLFLVSREGFNPDYMTPEELFWWRLWLFLECCCGLVLRNQRLKLLNAVLRFRQRRLERRILRLERVVIRLQRGEVRTIHALLAQFMNKIRFCCHRPQPVVVSPLRVTASDRHNICILPDAIPRGTVTICI